MWASVLGYNMSLRGTLSSYFVDKARIVKCYLLALSLTPPAHFPALFLSSINGHPGRLKA